MSKKNKIVCDKKEIKKVFKLAESILDKKVIFHKLNVKKLHAEINRAEKIICDIIDGMYYINDDEKIRDLANIKSQFEKIRDEILRL